MIFQASEFFSTPHLADTLHFFFLPSFLLSSSIRGEWPSGLYSLRQVTEVKLGRVRSDFGWVTTEA